MAAAMMNVVILKARGLAWGAGAAAAAFLGPLPLVLLCLLPLLVALGASHRFLETEVSAKTREALINRWGIKHDARPLLSSDSGGSRVPGPEERSKLQELLKGLVKRRAGKGPLVSPRQRVNSNAVGFGFPPTPGAASAAFAVEPPRAVRRRSSVQLTSAASAAAEHAPSASPRGLSTFGAAAIRAVVDHRVHLGCVLALSIAVAARNEGAFAGFAASALPSLRQAAAAVRASVRSRPVSAVVPDGTLPDAVALPVASPVDAAAASDTCSAAAEEAALEEQVLDAVKAMGTASPSTPAAAATTALPAVMRQFAAALSSSRWLQLPSPASMDALSLSSLVGSITRRWELWLAAAALCAWAYGVWAQRRGRGRRKGKPVGRWVGLLARTRLAQWLWLRTELEGVRPADTPAAPTAVAPAAPRAGFIRAASSPGATAPQVTSTPPATPLPTPFPPAGGNLGGLGNSAASTPVGSPRSAFDGSYASPSAGTPADEVRRAAAAMRAVQRAARRASLVATIASRTGLPLASPQLQEFKARLGGGVLRSEFFPTE